MPFSKSFGGLLTQMELDRGRFSPEVGDVAVMLCRGPVAAKAVGNAVFFGFSRVLRCCSTASSEDSVVGDGSEYPVMSDAAASRVSACLTCCEAPKQHLF